MNRTSIAALALALPLALTSCFQPDPPRTVAQQYWQALVDKDMETARQLVSSGSQTMLEAHVEAVNAPETLTRVALDDDRTVVVTTINPDTAKPYNDRPFETVMVLEDGEWKIDLQQTRIPPPPTDLEKHLNEMADSLSGPVEDNLDTMENMVEEGMRLLDETLEQGSKEMGKSFERAMQKMREAMQESIDRMKQRRGEQEPAAPAGPADNSGEGVI